MRTRTVIPIIVATLALVAGPVRAGLVPEFGVKGGLNFADIDVDDIDTSNHTGWAAGVYLDLASPLLHLQPEALVTRKGFEGGEFTTSPHKLDYRSTWLEVPVLIVFEVPLPAVSPRVFAGPAISFPLQSEVQFGDGDWIEIEDDTKSAWSVVLGGGVKLGRLGLEVRYDIGMSEINDRPLGDIVESIPDDVEGKDIEDRTWSLMASFGL